MQPRAKLQETNFEVCRALGAANLKIGFIIRIARALAVCNEKLRYSVKVKCELVLHAN